MALRTHHLAVEEVCQRVEICVDKRTGKRWVRAEKAMEPNELIFYPIAPKARGYLVHSDHPFRATCTVARCEKAAGGGEDVEVNKREYHLLPDFKLPDVEEAAFGDVEAAAAAASNDEGVAMKSAVEATRHWKWIGAESVYP